MAIVDSGTVKFCTECRLKFDPEVSGPNCPNCKTRIKLVKAQPKAKK